MPGIIRRTAPKTPQQKLDASLKKSKTEFELFKVNPQAFSTNKAKTKMFQGMMNQQGGGGGGGTSGGGGSAGGGGSGAMAKARELYAPGGSYEKGLNAQLDRGSKKAIASGTQSLVSSGLASTSMGAGLGKQYEEEVAAPARADLESRRVSAMAGLYSQEAGMDFQSSEASAARGFAGQQAGLDRELSREQGAASRGSAMATAGARMGPGGTMRNTLRTSGTSAPAPVNPGMMMNDGGGGMGSFLKNLESSDIMKSPSWEF